LLFAATLDDIGKSLFRSGKLAESEKYYSQAQEIQERQAPGSLCLANSLGGLGSAAMGRGDLDRGEQYHRRALLIREKLAPASLDVADSLSCLGVVAEYRSDPTKAEDYQRQALAIREKLAPDSLEVAESLHLLGKLAFTRGGRSEAEGYWARGLVIRERLAPDSLDVAGSLQDLGLMALHRGDLDKADEYFGRALAIQERQSPGSLDVALSFVGIGNVAWMRRDLAKYEEYQRRALEVRERLAPGSLENAASLNDIGVAAQMHGDLIKAEQYHRRALAIQEKIAPDGIDTADTFMDLAEVAEARGDLDSDEKYKRRTLEIWERLLPTGGLTAYCFNEMGLLARARGDLQKALEYQNRALAIEEKESPRGTEIAETLRMLGDVLVDQGDEAKAEEYYRRALQIWERLTPQGMDYAETLAALARIALHQQQWDTAAQLFEKALNAFEGQIRHFGGTEESRSGFRARHANFYRDYLDLLMRQNRPALAFQVLERSRAQTLLEMLAAAHVDVRKGVDAVLLERERSLASDITAKANRRIRLMGEEHSQERVAAVNQEIEKLLAEHKDLDEQIRVTSPGYAALTQPQPLQAKQIQELLEEDTLLLEYSLGKERSYVWAVTPESLAAYELPRQKDIEDVARNVYHLLTARNQIIDHDTEAKRRARLIESEREYPQAAGALSRLVLGPVAAQLRGKKRVVIVSDGALQYVPFAALPEPGDGNPGNSANRPPLMVGHEIVNLPSASVLAVLRQDRMGRPEAAKTVAVLADPVFDVKDTRLRQASTREQREIQNTTRGPEEQEYDPFSFELTRSATDLGLAADGRVALSRLPWTRVEADDILAVTPRGQGRKLLDFAANHAAATDPALGQYRIVHFATHGLLDDKNPELSGLVLSLVDERGQPRDGFLGLREIYNLNLPVDLVVLSGCQTGLGKEMQGEGLIGLTRGFMYAGASRVVASLWSVSDAATAELMAEFYRSMEENGMPPAAALRSAQIKMWKQKIWRSPYFWAGFQIQGEWR
jgi:CHAT domain-containing protein/Tfp pilus assembly protein PilF